MNHSHNRQQLRRQLRERRRALPPARHAQLSAAAVEQLLRHRLFQTARHIACYLPNDGEMDLSALLAVCRRRGKTLYLPVLSRLRHNHLDFLRYEPGDHLIANRFGIPEPQQASGRMIRSRQLDLVLLPLVGFDSQGNRLGMGGGFYDRTFAFLHRRQHWRKPRLLGVAFGFQQIDSEGAGHLEAGHWDVPLHGVVTEVGVRLFPGRVISR